MNKIKLGLLEADLDKVAAAAASAGAIELQSGDVTGPQIEAAVKIERYAPQIGSSALVQQMQLLCEEYDTTRTVMPSGSERTRVMTQILAKMRVLAPSVADYIAEFKRSHTAGGRLAAVAIMQFVPSTADDAWLLERFKSDQAFVFFHSANVIRNMARSEDINTAKRGKRLASQALRVIEEFGGVKDQNTLKLLKSITDPNIK